MAERRRAVALARHFREAEGLSIAQIAESLGRSPATIKAYFYDPDRREGLIRRQEADDREADAGGRKGQEAGTCWLVLPTRP
ncbi:MAG: response regulator transcription factor [Solirubrobacterales bacterium]|nr:response regulator transcription factor [Solirubrobacterales bacterium]